MKKSKRIFIEDREAKQYSKNIDKIMSDQEGEEMDRYYNLLYKKAEKIIDDIKKNNGSDASDIILSAILSILQNENF